jgi:peptidoglycan-associated lipoprotein
MKTQTWIGVLAASLLVAGCASKPPAKPPETTESAPTASTDTRTSGTDDTSAAALGDSGAGVAGPQGGLLSKRNVYFAFDSAEIDANDMPTVKAHAEYLVANPQTRIRLEGHTDERGTREYNIGLGERRAQAVRRAMMLLGVGDAQIATVSYGEERPAAAGSDEVAWAQNRRVEIVYLN